MANYLSQITLPNSDTYDFRDKNLKVYTGSCSTAAGTAIKDVTTDGAFTLAKGAVIFVNFNVTNSAAVGNLKLKINGEADANAKPIKYLVNGNDPANIPGAGYLRANQTYMFRYDGTNWVADLNYYTYSNDFASRIGHYNNILARKTIAAESLIVGDETGYEKVASGVTFNLAYPIVWCTGAVNANTSNYANMFLQHYDRNIATGAKTGFTSAANKVIYLIVTINGNIATIDSNIITDTLPSSADGKVYISLGKLGAQSTGANYFFLYPTHPMFEYKNGKIRTYEAQQSLNEIDDADDLKAIEAISGTTGLLKKTAANTWALDTTSYATKTEVNGLLAAADAMIFKGTLGTGGTITAVPDGTSGKTYQAGYTYKVITAGKYANIQCEVGDLLIAISDSTSGQTAVNNAHWTVAQTNIDGAVTGPSSANTNRIARFNDDTGKIIKNSSVSIDDNGNITFPSGANASVFPAHYYTNAYDSNGNTYVHYYSTGLSSTYSYANLRVKNDTSFKVLRFGGDGTFTWDGKTVLTNGNTTAPSSIPTLSWGAESTVFTLNGTAVKVKAMSKPTAADIGAAPAVTGGYLPLSGGTLTGALTTANNTWNVIGDDCRLGDINKAGHIGIQGVNGNTGIFFTTYNQNTKTTGGAITWDGTKFSITSTTAVDASISGNAATATWVGKGTHTAVITANEFTPAVGTMTVLGNVSNTSMSHSNNANAEIIIKAHPTSGTSYYEARLGFSSNGSIYHMPVNTTTWERILTDVDTYAGDNATASMTWGKTYTLAKINGTDIKITMPGNPNTDHYAWADITSKPETATRWPKWNEIVAGADALSEGTSNWTDNTEILTSYASNNGFADSAAKGVVYRRDALCAYNYIKGKLDSVYIAKTAGVTAVTWDETNKKLTRTINGTAADVMTAEQMSTALELGTIASKAEDSYMKFGGDDTGLGGGSPAATAKTYWADTTKVSDNMITGYYNHSGAEYSLLFSKRSTYGSILKWGYSDKYLRILRVQGGTWKSTDWEKVDAGYADSAGTATSAGKWTTARTLTIGNKGQSVDGSGNVSWSLADIGAATSEHNHSGTYVPNTTGANDVNTLYNTGIYNITSGSLTNGPRDYGYGQLLVMSYRKHTGNTTTDWATQIYSHLGSGNNGNTLYYRTSNASTWQTWQMAAHADAGTAKGGAKKPIYIDAQGVIQEGTELKNLAYKDSLSASDVGAAPATHTHNYAGSSSAGGAATSANALNFVHTNEILIGNANSQAAIHINHRRISGGATSGNTAITDYYFKNGNGAITGVKIHAETFNGNATSATGVKDASNANRIITIRYSGDGAAATDWIPMHDSSGNLVPVSSTNLANKVRDKASGSWGISITGSSASCTGNAATANYLTGFSSRSTSMGWGNQTGSVITCFATPKGGGWGFRDDNPAAGQVSMTIDGTIYIKEGGVNVGDAIKSISRSGTTFTYTTLWGNTGTFTQQDTNNAVAHALKTTTQFYITGTESATASTGGDTFDTGIYATTTAGQLNATSYRVNEKVTLQWNSTDNSLDFVFA